MKVKRMGMIEILRRIWLFLANKIKSTESFNKQTTQLIFELNSSLWHMIVTKEAAYLARCKHSKKVRLVFREFYLALFHLVDRLGWENFLWGTLVNFFYLEV